MTDDRFIWQYSPEWFAMMGVGKAAEAPAASIDDDPDDVEVTSDRQAAAGAFVPARDKREAVDRISAWASGPAASLSTGSTEPKSVIIAASRHAALDVSFETLSKPELAREVVESLGGSWDESCYSRGSTVTLEGLNRLLMSLECGTTRAGTSRRGDVRSEAESILAQVVRTASGPFDGRHAVAAMLDPKSSDWAKSEWSGFYFEFLALGPCMVALDGAPLATSTRTVFDLAAGHVWDFKVHSDDKPWAILNDMAATDEVLRDRGGMGLVILSGRPEFDDDFKSWFDDLKAAHGKAPRQRSRPAAYSRRLKAGFTPTRVDIIRLSADEWQVALDEGVIRPWAQPRQPGGQTRNPKYQINVPEAARRWSVASTDI